MKAVLYHASDWLKKNTKIIEMDTIQELLNLCDKESFSIIIKSKKVGLIEDNGYFDGHEDRLDVPYENFDFEIMIYDDYIE